MNDFKKKIFDIIFEPEIEDVKAEAPLTDVNEFKKETEDKESFEPVKMPKAKELLYNKQEKSSPFIDYTVLPRKEEPKIENNNQPVYEMRENVSPIFGPIAQKERKKRNATEKEIQKAVSNSFNGEYTGIVISPIYGYDVNKANDARKSVSSILDTNRAISEFNDEEEAFDIPDDIQETIKEAVEEAVIELTPKNSISIEKQEETTSQIVKEVEEPQNILVDIANEIQEDVKEAIEKTEEEKEIIEEKEETTSEIEIPVFNKNARKATRSIYDTAPVQLFDFDELAGDNEDKDLFDELIGDNG